jgi:hypothetical protein
LKEAKATITDLTAQLDRTTKALADAEAKVTDPAAKAALATVKKENEEVKAVSARVQASVSRTIASAAPLIEAAQGSAGDGQWGVVYGGDSALDKAKYETDVIAPRLALPNPRVYLRQGVYRSVSVADERSAAQEALSKAKQRRADAYLVNMSRWCPSPAQRDGYLECALSAAQ